MTRQVGVRGRKTKPGRITFVGSGPGDPGLLTARAQTVLANAALVFTDPDRLVVKSLGLQGLPAFVFVRVDGTVPAAAEGWVAAEWRAVADAIAEATAWKAPDIPLVGDPGPFHGSPALG